MLAEHYLCGNSVLGLMQIEKISGARRGKRCKWTCETFRIGGFENGAD